MLNTVNGDYPPLGDLRTRRSAGQPPRPPGMEVETAALASHTLSHKRELNAPDHQTGLL
ncbi:hypothetical protein DFP88_1069 [Pseudoroseicyclus aestuarii]|uniref:Uncharacterized protein n=1 Tax=Pseudoroseicyclus aestuarii TaxID=1795041 RepID=A0A318SMN1_9RHOB|nr:hypothetical protein DFP88_1069 [Pseudoroseicyclus aestuarii]